MEIINLNNIRCGQIENDYDMNRLMSSNIYNNVNRFNENYNFIIMPMPIFNIIESDPRFSSCEIGDNPTNIFKVGVWCGYDCYVDLYLTENKIILSRDIQRMRENKINAILGTDELKKDLNIDIIF
jgi:hypothetical protein